MIRDAAGEEKQSAAQLELFCKVCASRYMLRQENISVRLIMEGLYGT